MESPLTEFEITFDREADGRWIAGIDALPGVLAYGATKEEALAKVAALADAMVAERSHPTPHEGMAE